MNNEVKVPAELVPDSKLKEWSEEYERLPFRPQRHSRIDFLLAKAAAYGATQKSCQWLEDEDGIFQTQCSNSFMIEDGDPLDNKMQFCCYCGGSLIHKQLLIPPWANEWRSSLHE